MYPDEIVELRRVTGYPGGEVLDVHKVKAGDQNDMADVVEAIENTLGLNPEGSEADVVTRLSAIEAAITARVAKSGDTMTGNLGISNNAPKVILTDTDPSSYALDLAQNGKVGSISVGGSQMILLNRSVTPNFVNIYNRLDLSSDLLFLYGGSGPILQAPDSSKWRIRVDNSGNLSTQAVV